MSRPKKEPNPLHDTFVMALMEETGVQFTKNQAQKLLELKKKMQEMRRFEQADAREKELEKSLGFSETDPGEKQPLKLTCAPESQNNRKNDDGPTCRLAVLNGRKKPLFFNPCPAPTWVQSDEDKEGQIQCPSPPAAEWVPYDHQLQLIDALQKKSGGRRNKKELQDLFQYHRLYGGTKASLYLQKLLGESVKKCIASESEETTKDGQTRIKKRCQAQTKKNYTGGECGVLSWTPDRGLYCSVSVPVQMYAVSTKLTTEESKQWLSLEERRLNADKPKEGVSDIVPLHRLWQGNEFDENDMNQLWGAWKKHCEKRFGSSGSLSFTNALHVIKNLEGKEQRAYVTYCDVSFRTKKQFRYPTGHIVVSQNGFTVLVTRIVSGRVAQQLMFGKRVEVKAEQAKGDEAEQAQGDWPVYDGFRSANLLLKHTHEADAGELLSRKQLCAQTLGVLESVYCESLSWRESSPFLFKRFLEQSPLCDRDLKEGDELQRALQRIIIRLWPEDDRKKAEVEREKAEDERENAEREKRKAAKKAEAAAKLAVKEAEAAAKLAAKEERAAAKREVKAAAKTAAKAAAKPKALDVRAAKKESRKPEEEGWRTASGPIDAAMAGAEATQPTTHPPLPPPAGPPSPEELEEPPLDFSPAPAAPKPKSAVPRLCLSSFVTGFAEGLGSHVGREKAWAALKTVAEFRMDALPNDAPYDPETDETRRQGPTSELKVLMETFKVEQLSLTWMKTDAACQNELEAAVKDAVSFSDPALHERSSDRCFVWYLIFRLVFARMETEETVPRDLLIDALMDALSEMRDTLRTEWVYDATDEDDHYRLVIKPLGNLRLNFPDWLERIRFIPGDVNCFFTALEEHLQMRNPNRIPLLSKDKYAKVCRGAHLRGYVAAKAHQEQNQERLLELVTTWRDAGAQDPLGRFALKVLSMDSASFQKKHEGDDIVLTSPPQFKAEPQRNLALLLHSPDAKNPANGHFDLLIPKIDPESVRDVIEREARSFPAGAEQDPLVRQEEREAERPLAKTLAEAISSPAGESSTMKEKFGKLSSNLGAWTGKAGNPARAMLNGDGTRPKAPPEKTEEAHADLGRGLPTETKPNAGDGQAEALQGAHGGESDLEGAGLASKSDEGKELADEPGSPPLHLPSKMEAKFQNDFGQNVLEKIKAVTGITSINKNAANYDGTKDQNQRERCKAIFALIEGNEEGNFVVEERPVALSNWNDASKKKWEPLWKVTLNEEQFKEAKQLARVITRTYRRDGFDADRSMPLCDLLKIACFLPLYDLQQGSNWEKFQKAMEGAADAEKPEPFSVLRKFRKGMGTYFSQAKDVWEATVQKKKELSKVDLRRWFCQIFVAVAWLHRSTNSAAPSRQSRRP